MSVTINDRIAKARRYSGKLCLDFSKSLRGWNIGKDEEKVFTCLSNLLSYRVWAETVKDDMIKALMTVADNNIFIGDSVGSVWSDGHNVTASLKPNPKLRMVGQKIGKGTDKHTSKVLQRYYNFYKNGVPNRLEGVPVTAELFHMSDFLMEGRYGSKQNRANEYPNNLILHKNGVMIGENGVLFNAIAPWVTGDRAAAHTESMYAMDHLFAVVYQAEDLEDSSMDEYVLWGVMLAAQEIIRLIDTNVASFYRLIASKLSTDNAITEVGGGYYMTFCHYLTHRVHHIGGEQNEDPVVTDMLRDGLLYVCPPRFSFEPQRLLRLRHKPVSFDDAELSAHRLSVDGVFHLFDRLEN